MVGRLATCVAWVVETLLRPTLEDAVEAAFEPLREITERRR
jgi:hypothetical protein